MNKQLLCVFGLLTLMTFSIAVGQEQIRRYSAVDQERSRYIHNSRPTRQDVPLRQENISDIEVREVITAMEDVYPGAIVNISGVVTGCPCEESIKCTSQVWVVAYRDGQNNGLMLSRINNLWEIGLVQRWWLGYDKLRQRTRQERLAKKGRDWEAYRKLFVEQQKYLSTFPACAVFGN